MEIWRQNTELLRKLSGMRKGEFAKLIGVVNLYRADIDTLGDKTLSGLMRNFKGISREWMESPHDNTTGVEFTPRQKEVSPAYHPLPEVEHLKAQIDSLQKDKEFLQRQVEALINKQSQSLPPPIELEAMQEKKRRAG